MIQQRYEEKTFSDIVEEIVEADKQLAKETGIEYQPCKTNVCFKDGNGKHVL